MSRNRGSMQAARHSEPVPAGFFERDPLVCARELIGTTLVWNGTGGRVVETEAYTEHGDEACHTAFRPSVREMIASEPAGTIYTYLNYGMYWLFNILVKSPERNGFVLLRALEPTLGVERMRERRQRERLTDLCSGPGKLTIALGIGPESHGMSVLRSKSRCFLGGLAAKTDRVPVIADRRIGISKATEFPWRFLMEENPHVSVPAPAPDPVARRTRSNAKRPGSRAKSRKTKRQPREM